MRIAARIRPRGRRAGGRQGADAEEIDAALEDVFEELASHARRTENLERLLAARVSNPCEPSKATGENELATDIMCADRQRFLASVCDSCRAVVRACCRRATFPASSRPTSPDLSLHPARASVRAVGFARVG